MALHPGRMVEVPERQPYVRWTTTYYFFEEMRNMDLSPHRLTSVIISAQMVHFHRKHMQSFFLEGDN